MIEKTRLFLCRPERLRLLHLGTKINHQRSGECAETKADAPLILSLYGTETYLLLSCPHQPPHKKIISRILDKDFLDETFFRQSFLDKTFFDATINISSLVG